MWIIKHNGTEFSSDDFLIEDLENVERATGSPWSTANPLRDVKTARAFLAVAMLRQGSPNAEVETALKLITLKSLKNAFEFKSDDEEEGHEDADPSPDLPETSGRVSRSGPRKRAGHLQPSAASA